MKRIYFVAPDVDSAATLVELFHSRDIPDSQLHLVANDRVALGDLPEADALENSDLYPALKRGAAAGGTLGLLAGVAAVTTGGLAVGGAAVAGMTAAGAGFGSWVSGMVGAGLSDEEVRKKEQAIESGAVLVMADVAADGVESLRDEVRKLCPQAEVREAEVTIP